jgi:WD40 repeat protein/tetratricopeptide (TPR) repeat protein
MTTRNLILSLFSLFCASILWSQEDVQPQFFNTNSSAFAPKTYAVVIGVANYPNLTKSKQLNYSDDDALLMVDYLKTWDNVELYLYTNEIATDPSVIGRRISDILRNKVTAADKVILYFSGHGDISQEDKNGYLLLHNVDNPTVVEYSWSDALPIDKIKTSILNSEIRKDNVYLIFDACKSGYTGSNQTGTNPAGHEKIVMLLSSQVDQDSQEDDQLEHSLFSYYLINGLKGLADLNSDFSISKAELEQYVIENVQTKSNESQMPIIKAPFNHIFATYTPDSQNDAAKENSMNIDVASVQQAKSATEAYNSENTRCQELFQLMKDQAKNGVFFPDQVDDQQAALETGTFSRLHKLEGTGVIQRSRGLSFYSLIENGKFTLYNNMALQNGVILAEEGIVASSFSPSEKTIATANTANTVQFWNAKTGDAQELQLLANAAINQLVFASEEILIGGSENGKLFIWNLQENSSQNVKISSAAIRKISISNSILYALSAKGDITLFDLSKMVLLRTIKAGASDFSVLTETKRVISTSGTALKRFDSNTGKLVDQLEFKSGLLALETDAFEKFAVVSTSGKTIEIVDLFTFKTQKSKLKASEVVTDLQLLSQDNRILTVDQSGLISVADFSVNMGLSAFNIRQLLNTCDEYDDLKENIDGTLIINLNKQIKPIIRSLIVEQGETVSSEEIKEALRLAKMALEMGKDQVLDPEKLEINVLLLEIFDVLKSDNKEEYLNALKKVEQIKALDPSGSYAFNVSAELHHRLKNPEKAIEELKAAEEIAPSWVAPKLMSGQILVEEKKYEEAKEKILAAIELNEENAQSHADLAQVYILTGETTKAKESIQKAQTIGTAVTYSDTVQKVFAEVRKPTVQSNSEFSNPKTFTKPEIKTPSTQFNIDLRDGLQVGDFYEGGTVFYLDGTGKHGMCVAYQAKYDAMRFDDAMNMVLKMELNGYDDWYIPTMEEIQKFALSPVFAPVNIFWTTAKNHRVDGTYFWYDVKNKISDYTDKNNKRFVLPIRRF